MSGMFFWDTVYTCSGRKPRAPDAREWKPGADVRSLFRPEDRQQRHRRHDPRAAEEHWRRLHAAAVGSSQLGLLNDERPSLPSTDAPHGAFITASPRRARPLHAGPRTRVVCRTMVQLGTRGLHPLRSRNPECAAFRGIPVVFVDPESRDRRRPNSRISGLQKWNRHDTVYYTLKSLDYVEN